VRYGLENEPSANIGQISTAIAVLMDKIRVENLAGLFSLNSLSEDLFLPVFRLVFNAPMLHNVNRDSANAAYIDLADENARIAIQVTSQRTEAKITETLKNFLEKGYHKKYRRLVIFILTNHDVRFAKKTKAKWKTICGKKFNFNIATDILTPSRLLLQIRGLPQSKILLTYKIISQSAIGEEFIDIEAVLKEQAKYQLDYEKETGKYIPDIFVETRDTKNLARCFSHPVLFSRRILEFANRVPIVFSNRFLAKCGLPTLTFPNLQPYLKADYLAQVEIALRGLNSELDVFKESLLPYAKFSRGEQQVQGQC